MNRGIRIVLVCLFAALRPAAQITINTVTTDTVDLLSLQQRSVAQNHPFSLWATLLLPGSGHQSIGRTRSALGYISADVVALFGAVFFSRFSGKVNDDSRAYASLYAGAPASVNEDYYWQAVGAFGTNADFLQTLDLVRESEQRFTEERYGWSWEDESLRKEFVSMQKVAKQLKTVSSFFIGAMILNRVIAFIDLRSSLKNNRYHETAAVSFRPFRTDGTGGGGGGLVLSAEF